MLKATEGIIISEVNYGEKSKIINVLTKDGILGVMCKVAKSLKSPLRTSTMKFNLSSFLLYYHTIFFFIFKDILEISYNIKLGDHWSPSAIFISFKINL